MGPGQLLRSFRDDTGGSQRCTAPAAKPTAVSAARQAAKGTPLVLAGEMVEKCPAAGCWFDLKDESGIIRVDTKNAGFVVVDVPLHSRVTVAGQVRISGDERILDASGVRY